MTLIQEMTGILCLSSALEPLRCLPVNNTFKTSRMLRKVTRIWQTPEGIVKRTGHFTWHNSPCFAHTGKTKPIWQFSVILSAIFRTRCNPTRSETGRTRCIHCSYLGIGKFRNRALSYPGAWTTWRNKKGMMKAYKGISPTKGIFDASFFPQSFVWKNIPGSVSERETHISHDRSFLLEMDGN